MSIHAKSVALTVAILSVLAAGCVYPVILLALIVVAGVVGFSVSTYIVVRGCLEGEFE